MMSLTIQILIAVALDFLIGDPRSWPHPVKLIGRFALAIEPVFRRLIPWQKIAGVVVVALVIATTTLSAYFFIAAAAWINPWVGTAVSIYLLYTTIAACDLSRHAKRVYASLAGGDLIAARKDVGMIVGRDTSELDEKDVSRATVETVAENLVDGITAPLFYAILFGPVGALAYKAINTLDSTFGYKNDRYLHFGWASAKLDDLANWLPARLTAPLIALAALFSNMSAKNAWQILIRDRRNHQSPNAGYAEAAVAGALGVELGGTNIYFGNVSEKPNLGDALVELTHTHIRQTVLLMWVTTILFLIIGLVLRFSYGLIANGRFPI